MPPSGLYAEGTFGDLAEGRSLRILDAYKQARQASHSGLLGVGQEAMSTADFPTYISKFLRHSFLDRWTEVSGAWPQYTSTYSVQDFEEYTASRFGRFGDMPRKGLNAEYEQLAIKEFPGPKYRLVEWGFAFSLTRQLILSDRLDKLRDLPSLAAEAAARTVSKRAVAVLEANAAMWDGVALFHATHANTGTTALTQDQLGADAIIAGINAIEAQTDDEGYKIVMPGQPYVLIVPRALQWIARALAERDELPLDNSSGTSLLRPNPVKGMFTVVVEPFLTDSNNWYLAVNPTSTQLGFIAHITLNGQTTPFIGLKDPGVRAVLGGDDPYSFDFDEVDYKVRHDFDFVAIEYRGVYGSIVT